MSTLQREGFAYYLEKPTTDPFDETGMLPFFRVSTENPTTSRRVITVNREQQRSSLPQHALYNTDQMVFYDATRDEARKLQFKIGKVLEVDKETKEMKILLYRVTRTRMVKGVPNPEYSHLPANQFTESAVTIAFARVKSIQFLLTNDNRVPVAALKKLEKMVNNE